MQDKHPQETGDSPVADQSVAPKPPKFVFPLHLIPAAPDESEAPKIPTDGGVPAGIALHDQVKVAPIGGADAPQVPFPEVEPYPDAVNPAELFDEMAEVILRYVVLEKEQADAAVLWSAHTYLLECFDVSPLAIIDAPE
jgi:hypothetical protein